VQTPRTDAGPASSERIPGAPPVFSADRLSPVAGAEIVGLDLSRPLSPELKDAILAAFIEHHVLVFREQNLSPEAQTRFTLNFGELEQHVGRLNDGSRYPDVHRVTNLDDAGRPTKTPHTHGNYFWHTDKSYHEIPSLATLLHAVQIPPSGGDTQFANMHLAYDALPEAQKRDLEGLRAIHSWEASRRNTGNKPATEEQKRERPPVSHPVVRTHPVTGRKSLYLGMHTSHIEGMPEAEGKALLDSLLEQATRPEFIYTHQWREGDLVMWDNRSLLHRALANYEMDQHPRVLHRTVVRGTRPI